MPLLQFTLSREGVNALREALACLSKFNEEVSLEAKKDRLVFTALNTSKSAYACFSFAANRFFSKYQYDGAAQNREKFFCKLYNRALLSLFRARSGDPQHEKDTTVERCDVIVEDEPGKKSRFIVNIICRNGMTTKYRLPFELSPPVHARFNKAEAPNHWSISSRTLRQLLEYFSRGIEFLDVHAEDENTVNFTCFTEAAKNGDEVLKKPLHTSIALERDEFESFEVEEDKLHIVVSVKDFRAIISHAAHLGSNVSAHYSLPSCPMQLVYDGDGVKCEFLLMTVGERGAPGQKTNKAKAKAKAPRAQQLEATASRGTSHAPSPAPRTSVQPPVARQNTMLSLRPSASHLSQRPPPPTYDDDSLFVPQEDDHRWDPVNLNEGEDEDEEENARLEWDASAQPNPSTMNMRSVMANQSTQPSATGDSFAQDSALSHVEPTQRLSQVRMFGLFGE